MAFTSKCHEFVQEQLNSGMLDKMLIQAVKGTEVPRTVWTWTHDVCRKQEALLPLGGWDRRCFQGMGWLWM